MNRYIFEGKLIDKVENNWFINIDPIKLNFIQIFFLKLLGIRIYKGKKATEMQEKIKRSNL